jgi:hypothetical protein
VLIGSTTAIVAAAAIAASIALPPLWRIEIPAWAARGWLVAIIPLVHAMADLPVFLETHIGALTVPFIVVNRD